MASLKEIMNLDDDPASAAPRPIKRVLEPGPRPPHGPESSFPSSRAAFSTRTRTSTSTSSTRTTAADTTASNAQLSSSSPSSSLAITRSPPPAYPQTARLGASPSTVVAAASAAAATPSSSTQISLGSEYPGYRRRSNASADSMDSYYAHGYLPDRSAVSTSAAMRPNLPAPAGSDGQPVKLTPITGRVSKAKKGIPVHECDICQPPKNIYGDTSSVTSPQNCAAQSKAAIGPSTERISSDDTSRDKQQLSAPTKSMRTASGDPSSAYGSATSYSPSLMSMNTTYGSSSQSTRSGSGQQTAPETSWPSQHVASAAHGGHISTHDQYSLGNTFAGHPSSSSSLVPGFDEPRSSAALMGTIPTMHTANAGASGLRWPSTTSASSDSYSTTPSDTSRLSHLPGRSLVEDWTSLPITVGSSSGGGGGDGILAGGYSAMGFGYETALADNMGLLSHGSGGGYHDEASLYGTSSRDFAAASSSSSTTVRSLLSPPPTTTAGAQSSSETLVTAPTPLSTDRLIQPPTTFQDLSGFKGGGGGGGGGGGTAAAGLATTTDNGSFGASFGLTQAARLAIPAYLVKFWQEIAPKCPIVHRSSLEVAVTIPEHREVLACAMAAIATQYFDDPDDRVNGSQLHSYAWNKAKTMNDPENTYAPIPSEGSLEQRWHVWIDMETRRRVFAACFLLDVHSMRYLEQPPTKVRGMDYTVHETLMIPFTYTTSAMWDAPRARDWGAMISSARSVRTLASISLLGVTRDNVALTCIFDGAVLLAALSLKLPRRRSLTKLDLLMSPTDMDPFFLRIASLFPGSGTANAYMALQHTPLHILLSVSGDSWVFNNKVPSADIFAGHLQQLQAWRVSSSAAVAVAFAARALKAFLTRCISLDNEGRESIIRPRWADITDHWGFYVCVLICWACGGVDTEVLDIAPFTLSGALQTVDFIAQLSPREIHDVVGVHHTRQIVGLGRRLLVKDCLGGRSILMADAVNVLTKLDGGLSREW
ncbi:hypothetical protein LIA77_04132 [Sarocladium implicatum]|nr:hypothetical protein LIA77_04132 [Sarocladium implicatum]